MAAFARWALLLTASLSPAVASAQTIGTFRWQMQPYCNVLTLTVVQSSGVFVLDGYDDRCGADARAPVSGTAIPNLDGTIEVGLNVISPTGATPAHVAVAIDPQTLGGTWVDSANDQGPFVFTPGAPLLGGKPRLLNGLIGSLALNPQQIQRRVIGACEVGQFIRAIGEDGSVTCSDIRPLRPLASERAGEDVDLRAWNSSRGSSHSSWAVADRRPERPRISWAPARIGRLGQSFE